MLHKLYVACTDFHSLPRAGGVLDQPWILLDGILGVRHAYKKAEAEERKKLDRKLRNKNRGR